MPKKINTVTKTNKYVCLLYSKDQTNDSEAPEETIFFSSELSSGLLSLAFTNIFNEGKDIPFKNLPVDSKLYSKERSELFTLDEYFERRAYTL